jgi:hypothetical protein
MGASSYKKIGSSVIPVVSRVFPFQKRGVRLEGGFQNKDNLTTRIPEELKLLYLFFIN